MIEILLTLLCIVVGFFVLTFLIYMFNLDMKLSAKLLPWFTKHYDKIKRDRRL